MSYPLYTYSNNNGKYQDLLDKFCSFLIPSSNTCTTLEGVVLQAAISVYNDVYTNGGITETSEDVDFLRGYFKGEEDYYIPFESILELEDLVDQDPEFYPKEFYSEAETFIDHIIEHIDYKEGQYLELISA